MIYVIYIYFWLCWLSMMLDGRFYSQAQVEVVKKGHEAAKAMMETEMQRLKQENAQLASR